MYLDINHPLSEQNTTALEKARTDVSQPAREADAFFIHLQIEVAIPLFKNHQRHWGADTLLREQLKSVKDTRNKAATRLTKKGKDKEVVAQ